MIGYIKSPKTYTTLKEIQILSYELPIEADLSEKGSVTVEGVVGDQYERMLLIIDGLNEYTFVIGENSSSFIDREGTSVLSVYPWQKAYEDCTKPLFQYEYENDNFAYVRPFSWVYAGIIQDPVWYYPDLYAPDYATRSFNTYSGAVYSYLSSITVPETCYTEESTGSQAISGYKKFRVYDCARFMNELLKTRVRFKVSWQKYRQSTNEYMCLNIGNPYFAYEDTAYPVYFNDGHSEIRSFSISTNTASIISAYIGTGTDWQTSMDYYYLLRAYYILRNNGTVVINTNRTTDPDQAKGTAITLVKSYGNTSKSRSTILNEVKVLAEEEFTKNSYSHKAEFYSDKRFYLGQHIRLMFDDFSFDTAISRVMLESTDDRYHYFCGDLPVTASEQIRDNSWSYGKRLPLNPRKGQLVIV